MKPDVQAILALAPRVRLGALLSRVVPTADLFPAGRSPSPDFLYTSGKPNRYNLSGTLCLYMSCDDTTALLEFRRQFHGLSAAMNQPTWPRDADADGAAR